MQRARIRDGFEWPGLLGVLIEVEFECEIKVSVEDYVGR